MPRHALAKPFAALLLLLVYFAAGRLGVSVAYVSLTTSALWAPAGIALASMLIGGYRVWPVILLGAFLVNVTTSNSVGASLAIAVGNTLEGWVCAALINRYAGGRRAFEQASDIVGFAVFVAFTGTVVGATVGATSLVLSGMAEGSRYAIIWLTWWLGDATGALIVAPALILWATNPVLRWSRRQFAEAASLVVAVLLFCAGVFGSAMFDGKPNYPLAFFVLPLVVWAALRFSQREVALVNLLLATLAIVGTLHGFGPFAGRSPIQVLLLLQTYVLLVSVTGLILAAVVNERRRLTQTLCENTQRLRESEARYRLVAETARDALISIDERSIITYVNPAAERIFGYSPPELLGRYWTMLVPERLRPTSLANYLTTAVKHLEWRSVELPGLHKDGHEIAMEVSFGEHHKDGEHLFIGVARDITMRKQLEEQRRWLASIVESSYDAVISKDLNDTILSWNHAAEKIYGFTAIEAVGQPISLIIPEDRLEEETLLMERVRRGEYVDHLETVRRRKNGSLVNVALTISPVRDTLGRVVGASKVTRDITDRLRVAELEQRAMRAEYQAVLDAARSKSEFLSRMSHELRTPLNAVLGFAELLLIHRIEPGSPDFEHFLQRILDNGRNLLELIDALLDFGAIDSGQLELHPEAIDLEATVAEVVHIFASQAADKQIVLTHVTEPGLDGVVLDPVRLKQVLYNVLSNALKFSQQQGCVEVFARAEKTHAICIEIRDTGPGIDPLDVPGLFTEFSRPPWAVRGQPSGAGVSLALTRKLVEAQGGSIAVRSAPGQGSVFSILLPRVVLARQA